MQHKIVVNNIQFCFEPEHYWWIARYPDQWIELFRVIRPNGSHYWKAGNFSNVPGPHPIESDVEEAYQSYLAALVVN